MPAKHYLITGNAGSGKTTVAALLRRKGFTAIDPDENDFSHWVERSTSRSFASRPGKSADWADRFDYEWKEVSVKRFMQETSDDAAVFLCGVSHNQSAFYNSFDKIFLLYVTPETIRHRLASRTISSFGKRPGELEAVLDWHDQFQKEVIATGGVIIDGEQALDEVVEEILARV
jgi:dephospho-CoA kinase